MDGFPMPTTRTPIKRVTRRRITPKAIAIFRQMLNLEQQCCCPDAALSKCDACKDWWRHHNALHDELRLKPWEWPVYSNLEGDDPKAIARFHALTAASDAAGPAR